MALLSTGKLLLQVCWRIF